MWIETPDNLLVNLDEVESIYIKAAEEGAPRREVQLYSTATRCYTIFLGSLEECVKVMERLRGFLTPIQLTFQEEVSHVAKNP